MIQSRPAQRGPIVPFWNRLPAISFYPLRGTSGFMLALCTAGTVLGLMPVAGLLILGLTWFSAYKYSFEILRASADGEMEPPMTSATVRDGVVWRFLALQLIYVALWLVGGFTGAMVAGEGGFMVGLLLTMAFLALLQPGAMMSLAIDGSFGRAIDPSVSLAVMSRIGAPYFAAFALLFVIEFSAIQASGWAAELMGPIVGHIAANLFTFWGMFATFHLMGYLVYQYHEELGYEPETHQREQHIIVSRDQQLLEAAEARIRDGDNAGALQLLREEVRSRAVDAPTHELYRRLLRQTGTPAEIDEHARLFLNLLMFEKQERKALGLLREALDANPDFVPMQFEHGEQLAQRARQTGQAQLAVDQWKALFRRFPQEANAPRWAFDAGLALSERGRDDEARALLEQARARCADAALQEKIDAALKPLLQPA